MDRRSFLTAGAAVGAGMLAGAAPERPAAAAFARSTPPRSPGRFRLNYAPHIGMFAAHAGDDPLEQIRFMAECGFAALEDRGFLGRTPEDRERISRELDRCGMRLGAFLASAEFRYATFTSSRPEIRARLERELAAAVEVSRATGARWCIVGLGRADSGTAPERQRAIALENLKRCADLCETAGLVMLLEVPEPCPGHPLFLQNVPEAASVCREVDSPHCKVLLDVYDCHRTGHVALLLLERHWSQIGYIQAGDDPGRKEPGTGNLDFRRLFQRLGERGYAGLIGMDHGNSLPGLAGEQAVIAAYRSHDPLRG